MQRLRYRIRQDRPRTDRLGPRIKVAAPPWDGYARCDGYRGRIVYMAVSSRAECPDC